MSTQPITEPEDAPDEGDVLLSPYLPLDSAPRPGLKHPLSYAVEIALRKATERDNNDFLRLKPYGDMTNEDGPEPTVDPLPGREAQSQFRSRGRDVTQFVHPSRLALLGAGQTETDDIKQGRKKWRRTQAAMQGALRRRKGR